MAFPHPVTCCVAMSINTASLSLGSSVSWRKIIALNICLRAGEPQGGKMVKVCPGFSPDICSHLSFEEKLRGRLGGNRNNWKERNETHMRPNQGSLPSGSHGLCPSSIATKGSLKTSQSKRENSAFLRLVEANKSQGASRSHGSRQHCVPERSSITAAEEVGQLGGLHAEKRTPAPGWAPGTKLLSSAVFHSS